ncbi:VOC family protein [Pseudomonas sp. MHK4]
MSVRLNHTIVWCRDKHRSAHFLVELLGLPAPEPFGPMLVVRLDNQVSLDFYDNDPPIASQHYAFLLGDDEFDRAFARLRATGQPWWADPGKQRTSEINDHGGGRRVYFDDPDGHLLEIFTRE